MKKSTRRQFNSIYFKFVAAFLGIWWLFNGLTFGVIMRVMSINHIAVNSRWLSHEFTRIKSVTGIVFLISACLGTVIILLVVRGIVKPIKQLADASRKVGKGDFDVSIVPKSTDEVGVLTTEFNAMVKELKSIDTLRKDFVSNVSHEFRTPITSIKGFATLIRDDRLTDEQHFEFSNIIVKESDRLLELSSNMLRLSELDSQVIRDQPSEFSLDEQIRKAILILEPQWSRKQIEFEINLAETTYCGEENLLWQVWLNLLQNAIKFSHQKGLIRVFLARQRETIKIQITDWGTGISEEDKPRIFDRFYKGDRSHSTEGSGLGLVIAKKIIDLVGGRIYFESSQEGGTVFIVELPERRVS